LFTAGDQVPRILLVDDAGKVSAAPEHTAAIGLNVGATGLVTLRMVAVAQPLLLVYVMVLVPKLTAVTSPAFETVAIDGLLDVQALLAAAVPEPVSCDVVFGHRTVLPVTVGNGFTVRVKFTGVPEQFPNDGVTVTVAVPEPPTKGAMLPVPLAASPMLVLELDQLKVAPAVPEKLMAVALFPAHKD